MIGPPAQKNRAKRARQFAITATLVLLSDVSSPLARQPWPIDAIQEDNQTRSRAAAESLFAEGEQLRAKQTAENMRAAREKFEQSFPLWRLAGDRAGEAAALNSIALVYRFLGDNHRAIDYFQQALVLRRALGDDRRLADTLSVLGQVYNAVGNAASALEALTDALALARTVADRQGEGRTLYRLGMLHDSLGEYQKALDSYAQALSLARAADDRLAEATTLINLATLHQRSGENQKALDGFRDALALFRRAGNHAGEAAALQSVGAVYYALAQPETAIRFYEDALALFRTSGNRTGEAWTCNALGNALGSLSKHQEALGRFREALPLARSINDLALQAYTLHNMGDVYASLGEWQQALDYETQALTLRQAVGDRRGEARVRIQLGSIQQTLGERDKALAAYTNALSATRALKDPAGEALALAGLAGLNRDSGNLVAAREQIEDALSIVESVRGKLAIHELRTSYFASVQKQYEFHVDLLMQLHKLRPTEGFDAAALQASEHARARTLLELLTEGRADIRQGVDPTLLERAGLLHRRLNTKAEQQMRLLAQPGAGDRAAAATKELDALTTELQEVEGQIRARSPRYAALMQPQPITVRQIQQLLDTDTLLLEYALGEERSYLWLVSQSAVFTYALPGRAEIEAAARRVYDLLTARQDRARLTGRPEGARASKGTAEYWREAATLSDMLLGPVASRLGAKRLLIVGDEALQYLPFAALPRPQGSSVGAFAGSLGNRESEIPLMVDHEIISLPSASTLAVLRRELAGRPPAANAVAVLADPVFDSEDERVSKVVGDRAQSARPAVPNNGPFAADVSRAAREVGSAGADGRLTRLPFTRGEAEGILSLSPSAQVLRAFDFQASRETATGTDLGRYRIVHFATHGFLYAEHPELSGIVLSLVDSHGAPQDGFLRLHDVYNLNLPVELVVLSACQSALGKAVKGEGLVGLTRGFMYAGAARVLASLWKVDDTATAALMKRFYEGVLGKGLSPAAALRSAQLSLWKQRRWSAPYYWAAFVLQGELRGLGEGRERRLVSQQ